MRRASEPKRSLSSSVSTRALLVCLCVLLPACDADDPDMDGGADASVDVTIVSFRFDPDGEGFYRMPWPSDARLTADGTPDLSDFPRRGPPTESPLSLVESDVRGFSTMPVVYLPMGNGIAEGSIPSGTDAMRDDSPIQLVDLSEDACGTRLPIEARFDAGGTPLRDDNVLRVANAIGTVLTPGHPYGLLVLDTLGEAEGRSTPRPDAFDAALRDEAETDAISRSLAPLRRCAPDAGVPLERIAVATVFTPHDPAEDMQRLRDFVMDPSLETRPLRDWDRSDALSRRRLDLETHTAIVEMPVFQEGETPYTTSGGNIVFEDGDPVLQRWEDVAMVVAYGRLADPPSGPRPVLVFQDGTGWSPWTHLNRGWINEAIDAGYVVVSFMPQFHGGRAGFEGNTELTTFNLPNPPAGRSNFRQQAAETSFMVRVIREQLDGLDGLPELDLSHLVYGGHSQGALVGAIVAGVETEYDAYALNGLSSFLTLTILHRKDIIDFAVVVSTSYGFLGELDRFSLLLQMIQMGGDAVDPHNYATRWRGWTENPSGNHVFVINGREDTTTTPRGIEHLTMVADMPPTAPAGWDVDPAGVWDGEAVALPAMGNTAALDGSLLTIGTYLDAAQGHFTIYRELPPREMAVHFWNTSQDGVPEVARLPVEASCEDGTDDNGDDRVDCADPTCAARAPCAEERCDDEADDDGDGDIDCDDPDCARSTDCAEVDCDDGADDDGDGDIDCDDADCAFACRERDCSNGEDDDGDGSADCADSDCSRSSACRETRCNNDMDEDGDGAVDCDDPDCEGSPACPELMCTGGTDEDLDGLTDCDDPNCFDVAACGRERETNCSDGMDGDSDGEADCRDADCATFATCAAATCADGTLGPQTGIGLFRGTLTDAGDDLPPGDCTAFGSGEDTQDLVLAWTAPAAGTFLLSTAGSETDTVLHVLGPTCEPLTEIACDDDEVPLATSALELTAEAGESFAIVVSGYEADDVGEFVLHIVPAP